MLIKCEACGKFVPKESITTVENIYGKTSDEKVKVCANCAAYHYSIHNLTFYKELHEIMLERNEQLKREKKELKKRKKKEKAKKTDE